MNRRGFLSTLAAVTATAVLDPEKLLWRPGKLISIPGEHVFNEYESALTPYELEIFPPEIIDRMAARMAASIDAEIIERYAAQYDKRFIQRIQWGANPDGPPKVSLLADVYRRNRSH